MAAYRSHLRDLALGAAEALQHPVTSANHTPARSCSTLASVSHSQGCRKRDTRPVAPVGNTLRLSTHPPNRSVSATKKINGKPSSEIVPNLKGGPRLHGDSIHGSGSALLYGFWFAVDAVAEPQRGGICICCRQRLTKILEQSTIQAWIGPFFPGLSGGLCATNVVNG
jgi:hypothetical protein